MDAYRQFVEGYKKTLDTRLPAPKMGDNRTRAPKAGAPVALLFSPHPDDEVITGALALRLQHEVGARVVNVAVTLGSNPARREERRVELTNACALLGWELEVLGWNGVTPATAKRDPAVWQGWVNGIAQIIQRWQPRWIFYPHADDWHPTHRGVNKLIEAALGKVGQKAPPYRVQTEYWQSQADPNLLVECAPDELTMLVAALCCHEGEVARNPYHLTLPAWMADNVRRGAERVAGPGQAAPKFKFGVLYRVEPELPPGWKAVLPASEKLKV
jgi:LmbE family N-acetylglucosaminyl deacetylase